MSSCSSCGSPMSDGGQSGSWCSNPGCGNDYYGGRKEELMRRWALEDLEKGEYRPLEAFVPYLTPEELQRTEGLPTFAEWKRKRREAWEAG